MQSETPIHLSRLLDVHRLPGILCAALFISLLATHRTTGTVIDTLAVCAIIAALLTVYVYRNAELPLPVYWEWLFGALCILLLAQILLGRFSSWKLALEPFFDIATVSVALFVLPQMLSFRNFARIAGLALAGVLIADIVGFVTGLFATVLIGPVEASGIGMLATIGFIGSLAAFDTDRRPLDAGFVVLSAIVVFLAGSRGVWLVFGVAFVLFLLLTLGYRYLAMMAIGGGALMLAVFIAVVITAPRSWVVGLPMTNRQWLWRGAWRAITETPVTFLTGIGYESALEYLKPFIHYNLYKPHGPHNGYLLAWFRGGILVAALHATLIWGSIAIGLRRRAPPAPVALAVAFAVLIAFENFILISLGLRSVLFAILCGYIIWECAERWGTLDFDGLKHQFVAWVPASFSRTS